MSGSPLKLLFVAGARPNFMKVAPMIRNVIERAADNGAASDRLAYRLVHTGQHYDAKMSGVFLDELGLPTPDINLDVGSGSHAVQTANVMARFEPVCADEKPDWVVVVGDVNSTLACALVCAKLGIRVAHVEAGLRSFDRTMPEEINRIVTDAVSDLLLTPSTDADENLAREGIPASKIEFVGNVMIDALVSNMERARSSKVIDKLGLERKDFIYVTLHRPSNVDQHDILVGAMQALRSISEYVPVVFPMHPRTRKMCEKFGISSSSNGSGFHVIEPVGYHDSLRLTECARLVLTDSGGLQEESTFFRTLCLTLRPNTERPVTVTLGSNKLTTPDLLAADIERALASTDRRGEIPPLWDGKAAGRIVDRILAAS